MPMRLGIDLDGVVARFNEGWTALHRSEFSSAVTADRVIGWDGLHHVGGFSTMDEFWTWAAPQGHRPSVFRHLPLFDGAAETLHGFAAAGHQIVILTAKPDWAIPDTLAWLGEHRIPTREVHFVEDKWSISCDFYLDDADHNLVAIRDQRPDAEVVRMVRAWNNPHDGVVDAHDWSDVHEVVTRLSGHPAS